MHIDDVEWPLLLQCFPRVFGLRFSFHASSLFCWVCDYELFVDFGYGLARSGYNLAWE